MYLLQQLISIFCRDLHARVLPDEAAHSQYEMRSFVRSDSGVLYPTGQGRLAEASNPVPSNTVANIPTPVPMPGNVPAILPKPAIPKPVKEKPKSRPSASKGGRAATSYPAPTQPAVCLEELLAASSNPDRPIVGDLMEDLRARQSRMNAYDDAIESVLRKFQETDDDVHYRQITSDFGNEDEPFIPPMVAAGRNVDQQEREAQIADTIDAVIVRSFNDSDHSLSPPPQPVASPPPYDDEDEVIEVHSVSPLKVEVTTDDILILPPPSPPDESIVPVRTLAERKSMPEEHKTPTPRRSKKPKNRQPMSVVSDYDKEDGDLRWPSDSAKPPSPDISGSLRYGIPDSYVKLEEIPDIKRGRQIPDDEANEVDVNYPLPMDAAVSLMKLAGVAPPPKRLRISYGSGRERMVENTRDGSEDYVPEMSSASRPEPVTADLSYHDIEEDSWRSTDSDLLTLEQGQRSTRDDRAKNRTREPAEVFDVSAIVTESVHPPKKGRPRKETKKRGRTKKTPMPVILIILCISLHIFFPVLTF